MDDQAVDSSVLQIVRSHLPGTRPFEVALVGEGDFCRAYSLGENWIFRFAHNPEGSRSLEVESRLLPALERGLSLPIPRITFTGRTVTTGLFYVGYPKIQGVELTRPRLEALDPQQRERCAAEIAAFLRSLHGFDLDRARASGVVDCQYPFSRTETGIAQDSAEHAYENALARLVGYPQIDSQSRTFCEKLAASLIRDAQEPILPPGLVHGDLSFEHILFDFSTVRISGVIDFTDVIITAPLLDFVYLYASYGEPFLSELLAGYSGRDGTRAEELGLATLRLYAWYAAIRLLWALEHDYQAGIGPRLAALRRLSST